MLFNWLDTTKCPFSCGHLHSHEIHDLWTHPTQHSKLHLDWFGRFRTAHGTLGQKPGQHCRAADAGVYPR